MKTSICGSCSKAGNGCLVYDAHSKISCEVCKEYKPTEHHDPSHYKTDTIECIDAIRAMLGKEGFAAYCRGHIFRYTWRNGKKDEAHKEAKKALVYSQWLYDTLTDMPLTKDIK